jgi:hypothetical protein
MRIYLIILIFLLSCTRFYNLTYYGKMADKKVISLKLDGYYYKERKFYESKFNKNSFSISPLILYRKGIVASGIGNLVSSESSIREALHKYENEEIRNYNPSSENFDPMFKWGFYDMKSDTIMIQYFAKKSIPGPLDVFEYHGKIINDTTINIFSAYLRESKSKLIDISIHNEMRNTGLGIYKFKKFTSKPDSLNWVLKEMQKNH